MSLNTFIENRMKPRVRQAVRDAFKETGKIATGRTLRETRITSEIFESKVVFEVELPEHAIFIDEGRSAGSFPPLAPIQQWMNAVGITGINAFVIARGIAENGIDPSPLSETILDKISKVTISELESDAIVSYINDQIIGND